MTDDEEILIPPLPRKLNTAQAIGSVFPKFKPVIKTPNGDHLLMAPKISMDPLAIVGKSIALIGVNGSGKSTSTRRLMEEHIRLELPFTICDIENEYPLLKELGEVVVAGPAVDMGRIHIDVTLSNTGEFHEMGRRAYLESLTVVLLLGDLDDDTRKAYLKSYLDGVFEAATPDNKHYYRVFLEECQEYVPQMGIDKKDPLRLTILRFGKRGRKRCLSLGLISQRPSNVDKDVLTQCHAFILHFVTYDTDIQVYEKALGIKNAAEKVKEMQAAGPGHAIYLFGDIKIEDRIIMPRTSSPWDDGIKIDPTKFHEVSTAELQAIISKDQDDSGMSLIQTAYLRQLEKSKAFLERENAKLYDLQGTLETRVSELQERAPILTGSDALDKASAQIRALQDALAEANVFAKPMRALADHIVLVPPVPLKRRG